MNHLPAGTAAFMALLLTAPSSAAGQGVALATLTPGTERSPRTEVIVADAVTFAATPPAFETVEIHRPRELPAGAPARYQVLATGAVPVLGALGGTLRPGSESSVVLTFSVPRRARAGISEVARVRFVVDGAIPVEVPVLLEVMTARRIELRAMEEGLVGIQGDRLTLRYTVTNLGNRAEQVTVDAIVPPGWRVNGSGRAAMDLGVNATQESRLGVDLPTAGVTGSARVRLIASIGGQPVATLDVAVTLLAEQRVLHSGPRLTTAVSVAQGASGRAYRFTTAIEGPVAPGVRVRGRLEGPSSSGGHLFLHRLGSAGYPSSMALEADAWQVAVGYAGVRLGELTGSTAMGTGAVATVRGARWSATALAAQPGSGRAGDQRAGFMAGGRVEWQAGLVHLTATGARFEERGYESRALDALGLGATVPAVWGGQLSAELAHRRLATTSGLGYTARFARRTPTDHLSVQVMHAPGGRTGFAQAADQVNLQAGRTIARRVGLHGGYWHSRDGASAGFSQLGSTGWNGGASLRVTDGVSFDLGGRNSRVEATGRAGRFATVEEAVEVGLNLYSRAFFARGRSTFGATRRESLAASDTLAVVEFANRVSVDGSLGVRSSAGHFSLNGRYEPAGRASGGMPTRAEISARMEGVPILSLGGLRVRATAELRQSFWPGLGPAQTTASAGVTAELPAGFVVDLAAERNPFFIQSNGSTAWVHGIRIERSIGLPALRQAETRGVVYHDLNGNGRRDPGEPGHPGAVLRRGNETVVSRADGSYRLAGAGAGAVLDPLSLGHGWITGLTGGVDGRHDIAVIPVAPVEVRLEIADSQGLGMPAELLAPAAVLARDESGRTWVARRAGATVAVFDALPSGRYTLEVDLTEVTEPLTVVGAWPAFTVGPAVGVAPIVVRFKPRSIQIRRLGLAQP